MRKGLMNNMLKVSPEHLGAAMASKEWNCELMAAAGCIREWG